MEKKKVYITNFTRFEAVKDGSGRIAIVRDDAGTEIGFEVRGVLTTFDVRNENGHIFTKQSYDKFVDDYFIKNSLNVPLCLLHNDGDPRTLCGIVKSMTKTDSGVEIVGFVFKSAYYYNMIKDQIEKGLYQGFSNAGSIMEAEYNSDTDAVIIKDFALMHAAIVCNPSDTGAKLQVENTVFKGFETQKEQPKPEPVVNEILQSADDFMMSV